MFNTTQIRAIQGSASAAAPRRIAQTVPSATANAPRRTKTLADQLETLKREGHEPALKCYLASEYHCQGGFEPEPRSDDKLCTALVGLGAQDNQCQKGPDHELLGKLGQLSHSNLDVTALLVGQVGAVRRVFRNESPDLNISFGRPEGTMTEEMWKSILDFCDKYHAQHMLFADELSRSLRSASTSANVTNTTAGASTEESAPAAPSSDFQN